MTSNELTVFEQQLEPMKPRLAEVLPPGLPVDRLVRTLMVSVELAPELLQCNRGSLMRAAMTAAVLGLEVDGVTGQGHIVKFGDQAQFITGYKGYNTLAARSGYTITAAVVREGEPFEVHLGSAPFINHTPGEGEGRIIGAYAVARHSARPLIVAYLPIGDLLATKEKSLRGNKPPWSDPKIGFPAMCEKTARRRLARSMPLNVMQWAARSEEAYEEQGLLSHVTAEGTIVQEAPALAHDQKEETEPDLSTEAHIFKVALSDGTERNFQSAETWSGFMRKGIEVVDNVGRLESFWRRNAGHIKDAREIEEDVVKALEQTYVARLNELKPAEEEEPAYG